MNTEFIAIWVYFPKLSKSEVIAPSADQFLTDFFYFIKLYKTIPIVLKVKLKSEFKSRHK